MSTLEIIFAVGIVSMLVGIIVISIYLLTKKNPRELQYFGDQILERINQDRTDRYRETESLREEFRTTHTRLEQQFFRINQTVDTKLGESSKTLNQRLDTSAEIIGNLQKELGKMSEIGAKIEHLDALLRAPKSRGNMGEENLEEILRSVFPAKLWQRQFALKGIGIVDAVLKTSAGLLPIDAKFPLPAFEQMIQAPTDAERHLAEKKWQQDLKNRVLEVAKYVAPELGTLPFAILFLPNENIYYEATIRQTSINEYARQKKVLIAGPNTLLHILQVLFQAYQSQNFAQQAQAALAQIQGIKAQAEKVDTAIQVLGKHIQNAHGKIAEVEHEQTTLLRKIDHITMISSSSEKNIESSNQPLSHKKG